MTSNPMQRKARLYFLLGVTITLLIAAVGIFFLYKQTQSLKDQLDEQLSMKKKAYVLNQDVDKGKTITSDMLKEVDVMAATVPGDYTTVDAQISKIMEMNDNQNENIAIQAAIDIKANTMLTVGMLTSTSIKNDLREQTYNMIQLPIDLDTGEYVDIRLMLPNGQDYIVLSKIKVTIPDVGGVPLADTIKVNVSEDDILTLSSAIVEAYEIEGSKLYAIKYTEASMQDAAVITYMPKSEIWELIKSNPNIVQEAKNALNSRYIQSSAAKHREDNINKTERTEGGAASGIQESVESTKEAREDYLTSLYGGTASVQ